MRSLFEIIAEILRVARNGAKKTRIMYSCNLSYRMTEKFLTYLLEADLLIIGNSFHTTEKGLRFLKSYQTLELLLSTRI
jgi:predicted transcriptional regulator